MKVAVFPDRRFSGFALVVTLSLMILLTVIAVGLLSLSAISLRSGSQTMAYAEARANARLALMLAIGDLQKSMGPDQRISASGAIVSQSDVKHPHWTGVWDSWKAGVETSGGDAPSEHSTIAGAPNSGMAPTYQGQRKDHFRSWLVSLDPVKAQDPLSPSTLVLAGISMPGSGSDAVRLVGEGSLGSGDDKKKDYVSAGLLALQTKSATNAPSGRFGWWIGDESQKARIMEDSYNSAPAQTLAEKISRSQAPGSTGTTTMKGLEKLTNDSQLKSLPSLLSLNLVTGATDKPADNFHSITPFSYQVLADVREGGLKRDLSTLLERPISTDPAETTDDRMLYRFDNAGQERVPIQDLAAYYQMYDSNRDSNGSKGVRYSSSPQNNLLNNGIQVAAPDYFAGNDKNSFVREYTSLYRSPVPIKIQMVMAARAEVIDAATGTYGLRLGLAPAVTFWNPNNVPLVMNSGDPALYSQQLRFNYVPFMITWNKNDSYIKPLSIAYAAMGGDTSTGKPGWGNGKNFVKATIFDMYFAGNKQPIVFEPGETQVMSYPYRAGNFVFKKTQQDTYVEEQQAGPGWKSEFLQMPFSAWGPKTDTNVRNNLLVIRSSDRLKFNITTEKENNVDYVADSEAPGAALNFMMIQKIFQSRAAGPPSDRWFYRNYQLSSRTGDGTTTRDFNDSLIRKGFPKGSPTVGNELPVGTMIANAGKWYGLLQFAMMAGTEASETTAGRFAGRKFASRPFLHATPLAPPYIDKDDGASLYNSGWNWWVEDINSPDEAEVAVAANKRSGFYGGGSTSFSGSTHVIQQEIPLVPPMSIASLSHAHLGGFSLANSLPDIDNPKVTAVGHGGLFPHTLQAIGNSYAHPLIAADKASTPWSRQFRAGAKAVTLADHSYLANKALWDEFFFSSITPQPSSAKIFENSAGRTAKTAAEDFFFDDKPLPNRRMASHKGNLDSSKLNSLFSPPQQQQFNDGLADKIAAHLMIEGPFNVNSTSVSAWKTVLSSLKGKQVAYFNKDTALTAGVKLDEATPKGTPVGSSTLPNGEPAIGSSSQPGDPEQWSGWRELTDSEITELATAIVEQVKLRGPFLSLSEFVNRRLDSSDEELSVKGALQAALDAPSVSINSGFRNAGRRFSDGEVTSVNPVFRKALEGPVAYGSAAYVDQADILRNFADQLTPRGDTFVIRTYGDSLDAQGKVVARAWCEAVVQRVPEYSDPVDEPHIKQADLTSPVNKSFGRKIELISFRWLGAAEV